MIIVMPTCDTHVAAAEASAKLLRKYWPAHPPLHVVHHQSRPSIDGAAFHFAGAQRDVAWLEAVTAFLRSRDDRGFLLLLDDYGLCGPPRLDVIERAATLLSESNAAGMFPLCWYPGERQPAANGFARLIRSPVLLQAALWRTDWFLELAGAVNPRCSPWGFEAAATQAAKRLTRCATFAADVPAVAARGSGRLIDGLDKSGWPLPYHNLMHAGRWAEEHQTFLIREGIDVPSRGLGDAVAKLLHATGLDRLAPADCGCADRQETLNAIVPFAKR